MGKSGVSSDHQYEQNWWVMDRESGCVTVDFIAHLERIDFDVQFVLNLIPNNARIVEYFVDNGEYWTVNTFGSTLKRIVFAGEGVDSLTDIYRVASEETGIDVASLVGELYAHDFRLFGYDESKIENNLKVSY